MTKSCLIDSEFYRYITYRKWIQKGEDSIISKWAFMPNGNENNISIDAKSNRGHGDIIRDVQRFLREVHGAANLYSEFLDLFSDLNFKKDPEENNSYHVLMEYLECTEEKIESICIQIAERATFVSEIKFSNSSTTKRLNLSTMRPSASGT